MNDPYKWQELLAELRTQGFRAVALPNLTKDQSLYVRVRGRVLVYVYLNTGGASLHYVVDGFFGCGRIDATRQACTADSLRALIDRVTADAVGVLLKQSSLDTIP